MPRDTRRRGPAAGRRVAGRPREGREAAGSENACGIWRMGPVIFVCVNMWLERKGWWATRAQSRLPRFCGTYYARARVRVWVARPIVLPSMPSLRRHERPATIRAARYAEDGRVCASVVCMCTVERRDKREGRGEEFVLYTLPDAKRDPRPAFLTHSSISYHFSGRGRPTTVRRNTEEARVAMVVRGVFPLLLPLSLRYRYKRALPPLPPPPPSMIRTRARPCERRVRHCAIYPGSPSRSSIPPSPLISAGHSRVLT